MKMTGHAFRPAYMPWRVGSRNMHEGSEELADHNSVIINVRPSGKPVDGRAGLLRPRVSRNATSRQRNSAELRKRAGFQTNGRVRLDHPRSLRGASWPGAGRSAGSRASFLPISCIMGFSRCSGAAALPTSRSSDGFDRMTGFGAYRLPNHGVRRDRGMHGTRHDRPFSDLHDSCNERQLSKKVYPSSLRGRSVAPNRKFQAIRASVALLVFGETDVSHHITRSSPEFPAMSFRSQTQQGGSSVVRRVWCKSLTSLLSS
jgi:hypothetical protein